MNKINIAKLMVEQLDSGMEIYLGEYIACASVMNSGTGDKYLILSLAFPNDTTDEEFEDIITDLEY